MLTVVKVGSNILTRPDGHVNVSRLSSIVDQLAMLHAAGHKLILVSSGAVACGRGRASFGQRRTASALLGYGTGEAHEPLLFALPRIWH